MLLLAPTRVVVACPPPGIYIMCMERTVHIWEAAWWTGHTSFFSGTADWIGVALLVGTVVLGATLVVVARRCAISIPIHVQRAR
ncbi:MAG TPA: hypothetical protein VND96_04595 [Candidatus Micrarchaeaceae archaeon]|nr:hypothetical protein [Candidatus Micrarchaeaceae archaeon]